MDEWKWSIVVAAPLCVGIALYFVSFKRGSLFQVRPFRPFEKWRNNRMGPQQKAEYAVLLHEAGRSEEALRLLGESLAAAPLAPIYERRAHIYAELGRDEEALGDLNEAIRLDPEPYLFWYTRAVVLKDRGEYVQAARDFRESLKRSGETDVSIWFELGNVYMKMNEIRMAAQAYGEAARDAGKAIPHFYFRLAVALDEMELEEDALVPLREAIKLQDEWSELKDRGAALIRERTRYSLHAAKSLIAVADEEFGFRLYESRLLERCGKLEEALDSIGKAMDRYPASAELSLRKGAILRLQNRFEEAEQLFHAIKERNPLWIPAYMELSTTFRLQGKLDESVTVLEEAKSHFPSNTIVRYWLADAYREAGNAEQAMEENRSLTKVEPEDPLNWKQRGELAIDADRYGEADDAYSKALALDDKADYYMRRSFARYMDDRFEDAMLDIQAALERDANLHRESRTAYALGELYVGMENWELAEAEYSKAMALEPDNPQIYDRRARCRFASDKLAAAIEDCDRGLALDPNNAKLIWLRGYISFRMDDYEAALRDTLAYTRMQPQDPQGFYNLGLLYNVMDLHDEAVQAFSRAIDRNPFEAQAYLERAKVHYHHAFDRDAAANDLAEWLLYAGGDKSESERFVLLGELGGFDDDMRERARERFLQSFGSSRYLS